jgi:integrase
LRSLPISEEAAHNRSTRNRTPSYGIRLKELPEFHSLRHTFATTLAAKGVHPSTAQKMLGHSDIRMTLAIYTHATDGVQDAATVALQEAFS